MGHDLDPPDIIYGHDIDFIVIALADHPVNLTADAPEAVNAYSSCHNVLSFMI